ncbi:MAG: hypothetical protein FJ091_21655 [Deltaproteobacteria bacterium]|nr:hypothetical protein [Deltaproteobacteria bacterium]
MRFLITALLFVVAPAALGNEASSPGCSVRRTAVDGEGVGTFSSECRWSVPFEFVARAFSDDELMRETNSNLGEGQDLGDGRRISTYTHFAVADRQVTLEGAREDLPDGGFRPRYWMSPRQAPLAAGRVQVRVDEGTWEIAPAPGGGTHVRFEMRHDAGGNLSPWIVRKFQAPAIARSLDELRTAAEKLAARAATPAVASAPPTPGEHGSNGAAR